MNLKTIPCTPFVEGFVRVASGTDDLSLKTVFNGGIELLSRVHDLQKLDSAGQFRLADHPGAETLLESSPANKTAGKIVEVPIRIFFDKPEQALQAHYVAYDANGRPVCKGDGCTAKRNLPAVTGGEKASITCVGSEECEFSNQEGITCRRQISLGVTIPGVSEDPLSIFEVRTSSYHAFRTLLGQLQMIATQLGGLRHVPLKLKLWQTSNAASLYEPFDIFKIALDCVSVSEAKKARSQAIAEEAELGLLVDWNSSLAANDEDTLNPLNSPEFEVIKDFYPVATQKDGVSKSRGLAVREAVLAKAGITGTTSALDAISNAVKNAARAEPEEGVELEGVLS